MSCSWWVESYIMGRGLVCW